MFVHRSWAIDRAKPAATCLAVNVAKRRHGKGQFAVAHFPSRTITEDFLQGNLTMRRTMHAAAILLACATQIQAQSPSDRETKTAHRSTPTHSENSTHSSPLTDGTPVLAPSDHAASPIASHGDAGRPFSQLAGLMQCNDWRPNLWDGYANERAAIVSRISQHVDMQCKCFECQTKLHSRPCNQSCGESTACGDGAKTVGALRSGGASKLVVNRYRTPVSTLFPAASDACCSSSGATHCASNGANGCVAPGVSTSASNGLTSFAPLHRMVSPVISNPASATGSPTELRR